MAHRQLADLQKMEVEEYVHVDDHVHSVGLQEGYVVDFVQVWK
jgi:hypothetical protein